MCEIVDLMYFPMFLRIVVHKLFKVRIDVIKSSLNERYQEDLRWLEIFRVILISKRVLWI